MLQRHSLPHVIAAAATVSSTYTHTIATCHGAKAGRGRNKGMRAVMEHLLCTSASLHATDPHRKSQYVTNYTTAPHRKSQHAGWSQFRSAVVNPEPCWAMVTNFSRLAQCSSMRSCQQAAQLTTVASCGGKIMAHLNPWQSTSPSRDSLSYCSCCRHVTGGQWDVVVDDPRARHQG